MKKLIILLLLDIFCLKLFSQNTIGLPPIINFKKQTYFAGSQNWDIKQDVNGIIYVANNEGLLSFDGTYWKIFPLPNKTIVRSIEIGSNNRIYVGGQDEIGFFSPSRNGRLTYTSMKALIPLDHRSITDVWDIIHFEKDIFFRTSSKIFRFNNNRIEVFAAPNRWTFLGLGNNELIAQDIGKGLMTFKNGNWAPLLNYNNSGLSNLLVSSVTSIGTDSTLITTNRNGIFIIHEGKLSNFNLSGLKIHPAQRLSTLIKIDDQSFALGTTEGCFIINKAGKVVQSFSKKNGLQNETIHTIFRDKNNNLWLGLETGIDLIAFGNTVKHVNLPGLNDKAGYAAIIYKKNLFVATSDGVYKIPVPAIKDLSYINDEFTLVNNTEGQTYGLSIINDNLLMGGHEGVFQINVNTAVPVIKGNGYWTFQPLQHGLSESTIIVAGNYNGIQLLEKKKDIFFPLNAITNFNESARFISIDKNKAIWTSHPYRGIYKIDYLNSHNPVIKLYTGKDGLPSTLNNHVYTIRNRIVIGTEEGVYEYNPEKDIFEASDFFKTIFNKTSIRYLREDASGNIWFINEKNLGVVDFTYAHPKIIYLPELKGKMVSGFEHIYPLDSNNVFIGAEEGFYHINYEEYKKDSRKVSVQIRTVVALGKLDSLLFGGYFGEVNEKSYQPANTIPQIHHQWNSIHIEFSSPLFEQQAKIEYSYHLSGFDKNWSDWSKKTEKDYTNLPAGVYSFEVRARNNLGAESASSVFKFTVLPPWYRTDWAYLFYIAVFLFALYQLYKWQQKRFLVKQQKHNEEQKRLQYLHQLELEKSEKEIVKLKNEKLEAEIEYKNSELASTAMHLVQKGELLTKIKDELVRLNKDPKSTEPHENLKKIIRILSEEERINEDWAHFAVHFDNVHSDFLLLLQSRYPNLSAHELKLCAYLRMNLSTKEIAQLMNISVRGVEISRYRLRKKLQIPTEVNLFNFLLSLQAANSDSQLKN